MNDESGVELKKREGLLNEEEEDIETMPRTTIPRDTSPSKKEKKRNWVAYALQAAALFTICNVSIDFVGAKGPAGILYFSVGTVCSGLFYFFLQSYKQRKAGTSAWVELNFVVDGKLNWGNVVGFSCFCLTYFLIQNLAILTFYACSLAHLNAGVVTTVWSINPLFNAIADYFLNKQGLTVHHMIGMVGMVLCLVFISVSKIVSDDGAPAGAVIVEKDDMSIPAYIPVVMALIQPLLFTSSTMLLKHLTLKRGFDSNKLSFGAYSVVCFLMTLVGIVYWSTVEFDLPVFLIGFFGSIINNVGIVIVNLAFTYGPAGPAAALACTSTIALTIILAIINQSVPREFEILGLLFGMLGAMFLTIPDYITRMLKMLLCIKEKKEEKKREEVELK